MKESSKFDHIRSFVRRAGRMTPGQSRALAMLWDEYGLRLEAGMTDLAENAILEIGFGMGDSLLAMAVAEPQQQFIGIEVHPPGVGAVLNVAAKLNIKNIKIYQYDAVSVLKSCIKNESLSKVQIFFPDPWPKARHQKRRLIQAEFVKLLATKLKPGGLVHLATDWQDYAQQMLSVFDSDKNFHNCNGEGNFLMNQTIRPLTKFEKRGLKLGHGVWDLLFAKKK